MKKLLILINCQNHYFDHLSQNESMRLEEALVARLKKAEQEGVDIIFLRSILEKGSDASFSQSNEAMEFYGRIKKYAARHLVFDKFTADSASFMGYLQSQHHEEVSISGFDLATHIYDIALLLASLKPAPRVALNLSCAICLDATCIEKAKESLENIGVLLEP